MEYCSTIKKNEILSFATTRMKFEGVMLSEISQINKYCIMLSLTCRNQNDNNWLKKKKYQICGYGGAEWGEEMDEGGQKVHTSITS